MPMPSPTRTNRSQLIEVAARRLNMSQDRTADVLDVILATINDLTALGPLSIRGFGRFEQRDHASRSVRNPRTGEMVTVAARKRLAFRAAPRRS